MDRTRRPRFPSCGYDLRPSITCAKPGDLTGPSVCAWLNGSNSTSTVSFMRLRPPALDHPCEAGRPDRAFGLRLAERIELDVHGFLHAATTSGPRSPVRSRAT